MAEEEKHKEEETPKEPIEEVKEEKKKEETKTSKDDRRKKKEFDIEGWQPKTELGRKVKNGEIKSVSTILDKGIKIQEAEIIDALIPDLETDLLLIGQAKGKFGGGQRRIFKQTQKKTKEGNKPSFATYAVVGNKNGYVGAGYGKSKETVPSREKSLRNAKLGTIKITRGCGSWDCQCGTSHSIPFKVEGQEGGFKITLMPAPKGTGLTVEKEAGKILAMAGIEDVWSKTKGKTRNKINVIKATIKALKKINETKVQQKFNDVLSIKEGKIGAQE